MSKPDCACGGGPGGSTNVRVKNRRILGQGMQQRTKFPETLNEMNCRLLALANETRKKSAARGPRLVASVLLWVRKQRHTPGVGYSVLHRSSNSMIRIAAVLKSTYCNEVSSPCLWSWSSLISSNAGEYPDARKFPLPNIPVGKILEHLGVPKESASGGGMRSIVLDRGAPRMNRMCHMAYECGTRRLQRPNRRIATSLMPAQPDFRRG